MNASCFSDNISSFSSGIKVGDLNIENCSLLTFSTASTPLQAVTFKGSEFYSCVKDTEMQDVNLCTPSSSSSSSPRQEERFPVDGRDGGAHPLPPPPAPVTQRIPALVSVGLNTSLSRGEEKIRSVTRLGSRAQCGSLRGQQDLDSCSPSTWTLLSPRPITTRLTPLSV